MKKLIYIFVILAGVYALQANQSDFIKTQLASDAGWETYKQDNGTTFLRKKVAGFDLYALEIKRIVEIKPEQVFSVLLDVGSYKQVLGDNKYLEAEKVKDEPDRITGYQFARIPLVPNRHYLFSFDLTEHKITLQKDKQILSWVLLDEDGEYMSFINAKKEENKNPIYIKNGAGIWTITRISGNRYENSYRLYLDPAGWMPGWLVNSFNLQNLEQLFDKVLSAAQER